MLSQNNLETIKKTVKEFFNKTTFETEVYFLPERENTLPINVNTLEPQILIGDNGQTLNEIQYLLKLILRKKIIAQDRSVQEIFYIDLDINNYKKKKSDYLKEIARTAADEVSLMRQEKILPAMSAYDRRIIHLELANRSDVETQSLGEEPDRKIVVKPKI